MIKTISLILTLVLCLSLTACGAATLTTTKVEQALADCDGKLDMQTSGDKVTGFTYTVEGVNAKDLVDKKYSRKAVDAVMAGDPDKITFGQWKAAKAIAPLMSIDVLLGGDKGNFNSNAFIEKLLGVICDGKTVEYDGWAVSAKADQDSDSITISVVSK